MEDLHWADRSSRDLLSFLLSRLTAQRLVVLATYRRDDLHRRHPLRPVLSELVRLPAVERLELAPLDEQESQELVRRLAAAAGLGVDEAELRSVARRSEGNAFFAEELLGAGPVGLSEGLAEVLLARVEALDPTAQAVLQIAAVSGRTVRHPQLATVSGLGADELEQALRDAVTQHVLVPAGGDGYRFRHALLREAVYQDLLPGQRTRLHARFAELLADAPGAAAELAHHAYAAHDLQRALAASMAAMWAADARWASAEALLQAERALELWDAVPDAAVVAGIAHAELLRWAAWFTGYTGDPERAVELSGQALWISNSDGDADATARTARSHAVLLLDLPGRDHDALAVAQRAVALAGRGEPDVDLAWAHATLARVSWRVDEFDLISEHALAAIATVDGLGDIAGPADADSAVGAKADAMISLSLHAGYLGERERSRSLLAEATRLARESNHLAVELRARFASGMSLLDDGRLGEAATVFAEGGRRAAEVGLAWSGTGIDMRVVQMITSYLAGEWDDAEAAGQIAGREPTAAVARRLVAAGMFVATARGRMDEVEQHLAELIDRPVRDDQVVAYAGTAGIEAALWAEHPAVAVQRVEQTLRALREIDPRHMATIAIAALGIGAHASLALGAAVPVESVRASAESLFTAAEDAIARGVTRSGTVGPEGRAWLAWGRAELTRFAGSDPEAWTAAVEAFAFEGGSPEPGIDSPAGYRQAIGLVRRAEARLAGGDHREVTIDLRVAHATAERLGAVPLAGAVAALATRAGVRLSADPPGPSIELFTPRERSVLELVAGGRTNRQVGAELFISEKTVSVHLSRVMAKLGAGSRTEAVTMAYARGLLVPIPDAPRVARTGQGSAPATPR